MTGTTGTGTGLVVFGASGQVARELARRAPGAIYLSRAEADLSDPAASAAVLADLAQRGGLRGVINAAAWTAVDKAESEEAAAHLVNAQSPGAIAGVAAAFGLPFVHISTDYVFDGQGAQPFAPDAPSGPLNAYGRSKLAGEEAVMAAGGVHAILRTSWVFSAHGANFVKTMLRLSQTRDELRVVDDQIGGPTWAGDIAQAVLTIVAALETRPEQGGIYHFSGAPDVSWADFAREIFAQAGQAVRVEGIPTRDYPTPAVRPQNSRLDCSLTTKTFGIPRPDWRAGLAQVIPEIMPEIMGKLAP